MNYCKAWNLLLKYHTELTPKFNKIIWFLSVPYFISINFSGPLIRQKSNRILIFFITYTRLHLFVKHLKIFWHYQQNLSTESLEYFCDLNLINALTLTDGGKQAPLSPSGTAKCYSSTNALSKQPNFKPPLNLSLLFKKTEEWEFSPDASRDNLG